MTQKQSYINIHDTYSKNRGVVVVKTGENSSMVKMVVITFISEVENTIQLVNLTN